MKPRLKKSITGAWWCRGGKWSGFGATPAEAYAFWRRDRKMARLYGIKSIKTCRSIEEMKAAARQQRIKDAQRKPADVVVLEPLQMNNKGRWTRLKQWFNYA